jgi:sec-independent protein translocase protein TatC
MNLGGHLRELRNRLYWSALFILAGSVGGWFLFDPVFAILQEPFKEISNTPGVTATINFGSVAAPFDLRLQVSIFLGLVLASPFWLYNLWAYLAPALNKRSKRIALTFAGGATPLFLAGCYMAWELIPSFVKALLSFTPEGSYNVINANEYILFTLRILMVFGIALVLPAILLLLNYLGVMSAKTIIKGWRLAVFLSAVVAALATPVSDPMSMLILALPLILLYLLAAFIAGIFDKRKSKKREDLANE